MPLATTAPKQKSFFIFINKHSFKKQTYLEAAKAKFTKNYRAMNPNYITTTVGLNIGQIDISGVRLSFWDLGGQQELRSLWDKYYQESHAIIYIIDSNDREHMDESRDVFARTISNDHCTSVPLLVLANKQDLPDCMGVREIKPVFQQSGMQIGRRDCLVMPVSALTGEGVDEGIKWLVSSIIQNSIVRGPRIND